MMSALKLWPFFAGALVRADVRHHPPPAPAAALQQAGHRRVSGGRQNLCWVTESGLQIKKTWLSNSSENVSYRETYPMSTSLHVLQTKLTDFLSRAVPINFSWPSQLIFSWRVRRSIRANLTIRAEWDLDYLNRDCFLETLSNTITAVPCRRRHFPFIWR